MTDRGNPSQPQKLTGQSTAAWAPYFVYILRCGDGTLYTGTARDVDKRVRVHNAGKGAKFTRSRLPVEAVYREYQVGKGAALRRELAIKALSREQKLALIREKAGITFPRELTMEDFAAMETLEKRCYDPCYITPAEEAYRWYLAYPRSTLAAFSEGKLLGFVNLFPVTDTVYTALREGTFNDSNLTTADIARPGEGEPVHLFLSCIALEPHARGRGLGTELYFRALSAYKELLPRVDGLVSDNVTPEGAAFSRRLGMKKLLDSHHSSEIYGRDVF